MGPGTVPAIFLVTVLHLFISYGFYAPGSTIRLLVYRIAVMFSGGVILFCPVKSINFVIAAVVGAILIVRLYKGRGRTAIAPDTALRS
jgi:hypothetical protein